MTDGRGRLADKVAIVTGAGSSGPGVGTGKAMSILFAREGARVCLADRDLERAKETLSAIDGEGGEALVAGGDVTRSDDCQRIVRAAIERWGRLDVLVNNVGTIGGAGPVHQIDEATWDEVMAVNLKSVVLMSRHAIPELIAAGGGSVINITSIAGMLGHGATAYGASKAALIMLTRDMAVAYGRSRVRANCISPGHIFTPMIAGSLTPEDRELRRRIAPLGIEGNAWDVAWCALFLASDESRFITGACIPVDGGVTQTAPLRGLGFAKE